MKFDFLTLLGLKRDAEVRAKDLIKSIAEKANNFKISNTSSLKACNENVPESLSIKELEKQTAQVLYEIALEARKHDNETSSGN